MYKKVFVVLAIVIALMFTGIKVFDVIIVSRPGKVTGEGVILKDEAILNRYKEALGKENIPYELRPNPDTEVGGTSITWEVKYSAEVERLEREVIKTKPLLKPSTCFLDSYSSDEFISKLKNASIGSEARKEINGDYCVYWSQNDDENVLEIDPNIKEIRMLEAQRRMGAASN